jgi:hypothetical protein
MSLGHATQRPKSKEVWPLILAPWHIFPGVNSSKVYTPSPLALYVVPDSSPLPAPRLASAIFSPTGAHIIAALDRDSDRAGLSGWFACSRLLAFVDSARTSCLWASAARLLVSLDAQATVGLGEPYGRKSLMMHSLGSAYKSPASTAERNHMTYSSGRDI